MLPKTTQRLTFLKIALFLVGLIFILGIFPLTILWPSGWAWNATHEYQLMIIGIYATLGVFLIMASLNPLANQSLIWFTVWSSIVHASIMTIQAIIYPSHFGQLFGNVPLLLIVALLLGALMPRSKQIATLK